MAKDGNTYAKRQRETLKRQKAQEKRVRRQSGKKSNPATPKLRWSVSVRTASPSTGLQMEDTHPTWLCMASHC